MNTRQTLIAKGKIWQVYPNGKHDDEDVIFEGSKTKCMTYIKEKFGMRFYKNGQIRCSKIIWEKLDSAD